MHVKSVKTAKGKCKRNVLSKFKSRLEQAKNKLRRKWPNLRKKSDKKGLGNWRLQQELKGKRLKLPSRKLKCNKS